MHYQNKLANFEQLSRSISDRKIDDCNETCGLLVTDGSIPIVVNFLALSSTSHHIN